MVKLTHQSNLPELFRKRGWDLKHSLPGIMRQEARLCCVALAYATQPYGDDEKARAEGQVAVNRDIYKIYTTPGKAYDDISPPERQKAFWMFVNRAQWDKAQQILAADGKSLKFTPIQAFDGGAAHQQHRNRLGKITESQKPVMVVKDPDKVRAYIASETAKVGEGKGGWATCARQLGGTRGIPGWVSRQNSPGIVDEHYGEDRTTITLTNQVSYASDILDEAHKAQAVNISIDRLLKSIQIAERHAAKETS